LETTKDFNKLSLHTFRHNNSANQWRQPNTIVSIWIP